LQPHDFGKGNKNCRIFGRFNIMILLWRIILRGGNTELPNDNCETNQKSMTQRLHPTSFSAMADDENKFRDI
jgi:hypothetical protein